MGRDKMVAVAVRPREKFESNHPAACIKYRRTAWRKKHDGDRRIRPEAVDAPSGHPYGLEVTFSVLLNSGMTYLPKSSMDSITFS